MLFRQILSEEQRFERRGWCYVTPEKPELGHVWLSVTQPLINNTPLSSYIRAGWGGLGSAAGGGPKASARTRRQSWDAIAALYASQQVVCQNSDGSGPTVPASTLMKPTCSHCFSATLRVISLCLR